MSNAILERIQKVLGNLVRTCNITQTYVDKDEPRSDILAAEWFSIRSTTNRLKGNIPGQLVFGRDTILPIKHMVNDELINHQNQTQNNKDNTRKNRNRVEHSYKVGDKLMISNHAVYKYETPYKGPFMIKRCFTNGKINLQDVAT